MVDGIARPETRSEAALASYEELGAHMPEHDPRDQYTYMYSKFRSDYTLMEFVGVEDKSVLNVGCSFPVDEIYYARKIGSWVAIDLSPQSPRGLRPFSSGSFTPIWLPSSRSRWLTHATSPSRTTPST